MELEGKLHVDERSMLGNLWWKSRVVASRSKRQRKRQRPSLTNTKTNTKTNTIGRTGKGGKVRGQKEEPVRGRRRTLNLAP